MRIEMTNYGTKFNLKCPRCGGDEWSEEIYRSGCDKIYHKCLHCGADVRSNEHAEIVIVIEGMFAEFTPMTYDDIKDELKTSAWKIPEPIKSDYECEYYQ